MSRSQELESVKEAICQGSDEARSLLFLWLTSEPESSAEYVDVAKILLETGERNLAHLVIHRGLALFPECDQLALFALRLQLEQLPMAA
jgi:hypothetical protein